MLRFGNKRQSGVGGEPGGYGAEGRSAYNASRNVVGGNPENSENIGENELSAYISKRNAEINAQVEEFSRKNPDFDIRRELQNREFCSYVWGNGHSIEDAYYLVHRDGEEKRGRDGRDSDQKRIQENGTASRGMGGMQKKNPSDLSDDEIDDIIRRVRNGEKISF